MRKFNLPYSFLVVLAFVTISRAGPVAVGADDAIPLDAATEPGPLLWDDPGGQLRKIDAPVGCWFGVSVAVNCDGALFYTNYRSDTLYKMDAWGNLISQNPIVDSGTGARLTLGEMSWDEGRQMLWTGTDFGYSPARVYLLDPATGLATHQFDGVGNSALTDGIAFDPTDGSIWHTAGFANYLVKFSDTGVPLDTLVPLDAFGHRHLDITGICVGADNSMYVAHGSFGFITRVDKTTGAFLSVSLSPLDASKGSSVTPPTLPQMWRSGCGVLSRILS